MQESEALEALAAYAHEAWSGWMRHLFSKSRVEHPHGNADVVIPYEWAQRWHRQMSTPYAELREDEKQSDREEACKMLAIVAALSSAPAQPNAETLDLEPIKAREGAATYGPWTAKLHEKSADLNWTDEWIVVLEPLRGSSWQEDSTLLREADAEFIAHARSDVPALISEIERLRSLHGDSPSPSPENG